MHFKIIYMQLKIKNTEVCSKYHKMAKYAK